MNDNKNKKTKTTDDALKANPPQTSVIQCGNTTIKTSDDLISFINNESEWFRLLIDKQKNFSKLLEWISVQQGGKNGRLFESLLKITKPKGARYVKGALLRFLKPETPVTVTAEIDVFHSEDPEKTTKEFTHQLDEQWKKDKLSDMDWYIFSFGIAFKQMIESTSDEKKNSAEKVLERITRCFKIMPDQSVDTATPQENEWKLLRKSVTDEGLINLFYEFNPDRTFRDNNGKNYTSMKEIGLLFAAHPEYWDDRFLKEERNGFLRKNDLRELINKKRNDFLLRAFEEHLEYDVDIIQTFPNKVIGHEGPSAVVVYRIIRHANQYMEDHGIKENLIEEVDRNRIVMPSFLSSSPWDLGVALLKELDKKYTFTENKWAGYTVGIIQETFSRFQEYLRETVKKEKKSVLTNYAQQTIKLFFIFFPIVVFYFICIAYFEKSFKLINFLSSFTPFILTFDNPMIVEIQTANFGLPFLVLFTVLPAVVLTFKKEYLGAYIIIFILWLSMFLPLTFFFPLPFAGLTLLGTPIMILTMKLIRVKSMPLLISLLFVFMVIIFGDFTFREAPPSAGIKSPLNVSARAIGWEVFRAGPSENHTPVGLLQFNDTVKILARENGWSLIQFKEAEGYIQDSLVPQLPLFFAVVTDSAVPMMSEPSLNSRILGVMSARESVSVYGVEGDWFCIRRGFDYRSGKGYILRKYVHVVGE